MSSTGLGIDLSQPIAESVKAALRERLMVKSQRVGECLVWGGTRRNGQHGSLSVANRPAYAHQVSYAVNVGPIPEGMVVCHQCDNPPCIEPAHLFLDSQEGNLADMRRKGRGHGPPHRRGLQHHMARLTDEQVAEIRRRWAVNPHGQRALAAEFGCSQATIFRLVKGITRTEGATG